MRKVSRKALGPNACAPPFVRGSGGWCGCNCSCCPPCTCDTLDLSFQCGAPPPDQGSEVSCGPCFPIRSPDKWAINVTGITNGSCVNCFHGYNGFFWLYRTTGCTWESIDLDVCPNSLFPRWTLAYSAGVWTIIMGNNHATWTLSDDDMGCSLTELVDDTNIVLLKSDDDVTILEPDTSGIVWPTTNPIVTGFSLVTQDGSCDVSAANISAQADCSCNISMPFAEYGLKDPVPLPKFGKPISSKEFSLPACSVPCTIITVTITGNVCCFELENQTIYAVGNGQVCGTANPTYTDGCDIFTVLINGTADCATVNDGQLLKIELQSGESCCTCCLESISNPCSNAFRLKSVMGRPTIVINPQALRKKIERVRGQKAFVLRRNQRGGK